MKKVTGLLIAFLISYSSYACHIDAIGWCSGKSYFKTALFNNHSLFQIRLVFDTTFQINYITKDIGNTDTIIVFPQETQTHLQQIQFRYRDLDSTNWTTWSTPILGSSMEYAGCGTLPITINDFSAQRNGNELTVSFKSINEENYIQISENGKDWLRATGAIKSGKYKIDLSTGAGLLFIFPFLFGYKNKKFWVCACIAGLIFISCKKEVVQSQLKNYHFTRIETISNTGVIDYSEIKSF
jgi:hypothetical protein